MGEGGCADGVVGWGRAEYRKEAEGAARDIDEDGSDTDIKNKPKRRERREGATAGKGYILDDTWPSGWTPFSTGSLGVKTSSSTSCATK